MKKSKIFLATGALILAASAIFATKANKKFVAVTTAYCDNTSGVYAVKAPSILTTSGNGLQLKLHISGSSIGAMFTESNGTSGKSVFFH
jgi:hypothetical protein